MPRILISGYYGFDNIGDESILRTLIGSLREKFPDCELTVLSHNPRATKEKYGINAVPRMSPLAIIKAVKDCDLLISGGGSLLQDVSSSKSIYYYLSIIRLAEKFHKKVFIYSQGIGPIDKKSNRKLTAKILQKADGIVVRDERSAKLLCEIGIDENKVTITADPVIRMKAPTIDAGSTILEKLGVQKNAGPIIGWAVREKHADSKFAEELTASIKWLKEKYNAQSVLIPFHYEEDIHVCQSIAEKCEAFCLSEKYLSEDMLSIIGNLDTLVGVRLHSLIYAAIMGVPLIGISYDPKCTAFLNSVGLKPVSTRDKFNAEEFKKEFEELQNNKDIQTETVSSHMDELRSKLDTNETLIADILECKDAAIESFATKDTVGNKDDSSGTKTAGAISIVFILMLAARLLGIVREMLQANYFGTGIDADLYSAAYNSTLYLFTTVCYALCIAAVPILTKEFTGGRDRGFKAANNLVSITMILAIVVVVVWQIWPSTGLLASLWDVGNVNLPRLALYTKIMSLSILIVAPTYLMVALYQATGHYNLQGSMSIPYNIFLAAFLFLFGSKLGIGGLVVAVTAAWILQLAMSLPYAKQEKYHFRPVLDFKAGYIGTYFKTAIVSVLTTSIFLFCYLIDTSAASAFSGGAVSAFYYADKLFTPLITSVLYSISAVMFPKFNYEFTKEDSKGYLAYIWKVTENTLLFILPVCAMMCAFGTDIIKVIFESGSFTSESTAATGQIFARYGLGMCAFAAIDLWNKAFYAMKKTAAPLIINLGILALNLGLNSLFNDATGVALATSISLSAGAVALGIVLFRKQKAVQASALIKAIIATAVMVPILYGGHSLIVNGLEGKIMLIIKCVAIGGVACIAYVAVSLFLKQEIILDLLKKFKKSSVA